jgi:hypothetical protein
MKTTILKMIFLAIFLAGFTWFVSGQSGIRVDCETHDASVTFTLNVTDRDPGDNEYYMIYFRIETLCPSTSGWVAHVDNPFYYIDFQNPVYFPNYNVDDVGFALEEESYYFYLILAEVLKYEGTYPNGQFVKSGQDTEYAARSGYTLTANYELYIDL